MYVECKKEGFGMYVICIVLYGPKQNLLAVIYPNMCVYQLSAKKSNKKLPLKFVSQFVSDFREM